uniref:Alpha-mannosidase n=1 Tax=Ditylenchus dipsaci TaxID=166011 RepID=A0A915D834_9BILA
MSHTHDDLGWIKSVDEYFTGARRDLVPVGVQYILNTVIEELSKDSSRLATGQLELIGGGWVQPDEAASHYYELIDQYTLGLGILNEHLGSVDIPSLDFQVAWQIDPFGHSREHANLMAMMGYEALFFARQHYLELEQRKKERNLEFLWNTSDDLKTGILTGGFFRSTYAPPDGFCFDALCFDDPIIDNLKLQGYNLPEKVDSFAKIVKQQVDAQRHNHALMTMGGDFTYTNANMFYTSLDKLIKGINDKSPQYNMTAFYSTPSCYVKALNEATPHLQAKNDDFFPYASSNHSYWTGYFTSKPAIKGMIRKSSAFLQLVRHFDAVALQKQPDNRVEKLERAVALSLHHDAVTGTSKENVTKDYERRLSIGWAAGEEVMNSAFKTLAKKQNSTIDPPQQLFCRLMNESICEITKPIGKLAVTIFNGNSQLLDTIVRIPYHAQNVEVRNDQEEVVPSQIWKSPLPISSCQTLVLPHMSYTNRQGKGGGRQHKRRKPDHKLKTPPTSSAISNNLIQLNFDDNGYLASMHDLSSNKVYSLRQQFFYYKGSDNSTVDYSNQSSGAYIFRPVANIGAQTISSKVDIEVVKTDLFQEVRQKIAPWISQTIRLIPNKTYVEFDYIVGPIPKDEKNLSAMEVITRYTVAGLDSKGLFQTDANGRQLMTRKRNEASSYTYENTEPISANYYPVNSRIIVKDANTQLTILTDRSHGGSSLADGEVEIMLHRRAYFDDNFGVDEPLDEPGVDGRGLVTKGTQWLLLGSPGSAARAHRSLALEMFHQPIISFAPVESIQQYKNNFVTSLSSLSSDLPPHVNLLSLKQLEENVILLRLEHFYQSQEDNYYSQPVSVDLTKLFSKFEIVSVQEMSLAANRLVGQLMQLPKQWNDSKYRQALNGQQAISVELKPMEIKTFRLIVKKHP